MLSNLTGIRGLAALWVFSLHYNEYFVGLFPGISKVNFIFDNGGFGVDLFFCLSGFILGYVYFDELNTEPSALKLKHFFYKRFARLYPIYFVTLVVATIFYLIAVLTGHEFNHESSSNISLQGFIQNLIGVQAWFGTNSLNGPAWSLSAEFAAYLFFPLIVFFLRQGGKSRKRLSFVSLVLSFCVYEISLNHMMLLNHQIVQVLTEFTMGLCTYLCVKDLEISRVYCRIFRILISFVILLCLYFIPTKIVLSSVIPLLLLSLIALNFFHNVPGKGLSRSSLVNLGLWSYSLYMTHRLLQNVTSGLSLPLYESNLLVRSLEFSLVLLLPILIAFAATKYLENPARRYLLNLWA
jgi:peptidoglycan/LPS O-acetylase OafA/YrhL